MFRFYPPFAHTAPFHRPEHSALHKRPLVENFSLSYPYGSIGFPMLDLHCGEHSRQRPAPRGTGSDSSDQRYGGEFAMRQAEFGIGYTRSDLRYSMASLPRSGMRGVFSPTSVVRYGQAWHHRRAVAAGGQPHAQRSQSSQAV